MNLCDIHDLKPLLARYDFQFNKHLGQNFLIADWVPQRMAQEAGLSKTFGVLEIGPGVGALSVELAAHAGRVVAVELDQTLLPVLAETLADCPNVKVVLGDVMRLDLEELLDKELPMAQIAVCANLPYQIATPLLRRLLELNRFSVLVVMVQREVARRICARPGSASYGAFSVLCQYYARCRTLFDLPPSCFVPQPKVISSVVHLIPLAQPAVAVEDEELFFTVVRAAFAQRRKTLLNALTAAFAARCSKERLREILADCGLDEGIRGERLGLAEFATLTAALLHVERAAELS